MAVQTTNTCHFNFEWFYFISSRIQIGEKFQLHVDLSATRIFNAGAHVYDIHCTLYETAAW